ncbi:MAG: hypothetical protein KF854_00905 [Nitrospira sp.]|nr:hypothetical protein [Nitrospira sp.]MBX3513106.1 hypothetical protein [Xanthobacteraceae bacterium]
MQSLLRLQDEAACLAESMLCQYYSTCSARRFFSFSEHARLQCSSAGQVHWQRLKKVSRLLGLNSTERVSWEGELAKSVKVLAAPGGYAVQWHPSDDLWSQAENIFGKAFSPELRRQLSVASNCYSMFAPLFYSRTQERVEATFSALIEAGNDVTRLFISDARIFSRIFKKDFRPRLIEGVPGKKVDELGAFAIELSAVLVKAQEIVDSLDEKYLREDVSPWDAWISWLTQIMDGHGLPTGAANHSDKSSSDGSPSEFVRLIALLYEDIWKEPSERPTGWALAKAINRARKGHPKKMSWADSCEYWERRSRFATRLESLTSIQEVTQVPGQKA